MPCPYCGCGCQDSQVHKFGGIPLVVDMALGPDEAHMITTAFRNGRREIVDIVKVTNIGESDAG